MQGLGEVVAHAVMITGFVFVMMVVIEYVNVLTSGRWQAALARWTWGQSVLCAFLGATPGCLGAFAVASLYMHRIVTVGAAVAAMVATCGDESFVMLALFPGKALLLFGILFAVGVASGLLTDLILRSPLTAPSAHLHDHPPSHPGVPSCVPFSRHELVRQWRACTPHRGWLTVVLVAFIAGVATNRIGHGHFAAHTTGHPDAQQQAAQDDAPPAADADAAAHAHDDGEAGPHDSDGEHGAWVRVTLLLLGLVGLAIVATVPDHFLDEHLWNHIVRVHVWRIMLWTLGALLAVFLLSHWLDVRALVASHHLPVLLLACAVGILPESGPHLVFVTLYAQGAIPFSVLLASSIVQDGHGMIPLLAHSRRAFLLIKGINFVVGLLAGILGWLMHW